MRKNGLRRNKNNKDWYYYVKKENQKIRYIPNYEK